ncbi:MAG: histidine kinase [Nonomuraea sp.]|nr:histidine kinase [Nonomuraea sp.]
MRRLSTSTWISLGFVGLVAIGTLLTPLIQPDREPRVLDVVLPLIAFAGVMARERYPVTALIVVTITTVLYYPLASYDGPLILLPFLVLYTAADRGFVIPAAVTAAVALLAMSLGELGPVRHVDNATFVMIIGWMSAAVAFGGVTRTRRALLREVEQRALVAEHGREEEARRRASEERLRIARDLHDVLGHNISMINVQAAAALHGMRKRPEEAEAALRTIKDTRCTRTRRRRPRPRWPGSRSWSRPAGSRWTCGCRGRWRTCRRRSTWPARGSCASP